MPIAGGCLCGQLRYEIAARGANTARICWCRDCQYIGAGSGTANAMFAREAMTLQATEPFTRRPQTAARRCGVPSAPGAERLFSAKPTHART